MPNALHPPVRAVLGPTNTGKTHLAVERLCAHASGMMGFPLRLLAREVYDRVVAIKGAAQVALVTGEERIVPAHARYLLCTMEAMPSRGADVAFVALDEVQLADDPERGHVFTDRLLHARGREETLILGSATASRLIRHLVPDAEQVTRPRFSTLRYAGGTKLSRLPKRSAIVAFSTDEVYAIAEMLRRFSGGAAVVTGALSPRTRNAQVALFQAGEVYYLVATDAVGMGLNLDVDHVAFAGFSKFDGRRQRRLTVAEMAQIAGRAGRHQRDGSFGSVGQSSDGFTAEDIAAIENHHFPDLPSFYWRSSDLDMSSLDALLASLAVLPDDPRLRAAPEAIDLAVLRRLADEPSVGDRTADPAAVARLWDVCGLPDFGKAGVDHHGRAVLRLWSQLVGDEGHVDPIWFGAQVKRLDVRDGDVDAIAARIAACRTLCYIAHRDDWLADAAGWAETTRQLEQRLSDGLHDALTQRFVNRRTTVLLRDLGRGHASLPVVVGDDDAVSVDGEHIGTLQGFQFRVDPTARAADHRLLLAAAERHLRAHLAAKADALIAADDGALSLSTAANGTPSIEWAGTSVGLLGKGRLWRRPVVRLTPGLMSLDPVRTAAIRARLESWLAARLARDLAPLAAMEAVLAEAATPAPLRALLAALIDQGGLADRRTVQPLLAALDPAQRTALARLGMAVGSLDLFHPALLKPAPTAWRVRLHALNDGRATALPPPGSVCLSAAPGADAHTEHDNRRAGFRRLGGQWLRIDMIERIARQAHAARLAHETGAPGANGDDDAEPPLPGFTIDDALATSLGLDGDAHRALLRQLGFRAVGDPATDRWQWTGLAGKPQQPRRKRAAPNVAAPKPAPTARARAPKSPPTPHPHSPFAGLGALIAAQEKA
ncbi:MAG: hypothetical protein RLZZ58_468 [Pseudomonadota bacterium]